MNKKFPYSSLGNTVHFIVLVSGPEVEVAYNMHRFSGGSPNSENNAGLFKM
jgi:hypothetical protein